MSGTEKGGSGTTKTPADFLKSIRGRPVVVKLNSGVDYRACAALVDAGIPLKHLAVAVCCSVTDSRGIILDPTKHKEENMKAFAYLVFPNAIVTVLPERSLQVSGESIAHGIITSVTQGAMSVDDYLHSLDRGRAASARLSEFLRKNIEPKPTSEASKAG